MGLFSIFWFKGGGGEEGLPGRNRPSRRKPRFHHSCGQRAVIAGLDPAIHPFENERCAGQARARQGRMPMPTIAYFYGIAIRMYFIDHPPPHFFATYSGHEANVSIETGEVIEGQLPVNAARLVKQWALAHRGELEDNWRRARIRTPLVKIAGLDDD
jgi:hypothetical protein